MNQRDDANTANGPLRGLRVLEIATTGPGQFCSMLMADLGADVVRVERRSSGLEVVPAEFELLNRGKRSVSIDLKKVSGPATVLALAERSNMLVEGFRPGVAERLGIGPDTCLERNAKLVYGRATGWGQFGPLARSAGHDVDYIAVSSALHTIGPENGPPQVPLTLVGDFPAGLYLAVGMLSALHESRHSGRGQVVDAAVVDSAAHMMTMLYGFLAAGYWKDKRGVNLIDGGAPFYNVYATADEKYMAVGAMEDTFFAEMMSILEIDRPIDHFDPTAWPALKKSISEAFRGHTQQEWIRRFEGSDACVAPVMSMSEAPHHPHMVARNSFIDFDGISQPAPAPRFSRSSPSLYRRPSKPGEHTKEVIDEWLGE